MKLRHHRLLITLLGVSLLACVHTLFAQENMPPVSVDEAVASNQDKPQLDPKLEAQVNKALTHFNAPLQIQSIRDSGMPGLKEVVIGNEVVYLTDDGKYLLFGTTALAIDEEMKNLTEVAKGKLRNQAIADVSTDEVIIFGAEDPKHTLTVFTDVNCPYCKQFHKKIGEYEKAGIQVRYIMYPVIKSSSREDAIAIWCSEDRKQAYTNAVNGDLPQSKDKKACDNPIDKLLSLGRSIGINSTPTILLSDGTMLQRQLSSEQLTDYLDKYFADQKQ